RRRSATNSATISPMRFAWVLAIVPAFAACKGASHPDKIVFDGCAHAHNDYEHVHPLHDALDAQVFCSVEADIWLVGTSSLLVAHDLAATNPSKTLQSLY